MSYDNWLDRLTENLVISGKQGIECQAKPKPGTPFNWDNIDIAYEATLDGLEVEADVLDYLSDIEIEALSDEGISINCNEFVMTCHGCHDEFAIYDLPSELAGRDPSFDNCGSQSCSSIKHIVGC